MNYVADTRTFTTFPTVWNTIPNIPVKNVDHKITFINIKETELNLEKTCLPAEDNLEMNVYLSIGTVITFLYDNIRMSNSAEVRLF